MPSTGLTLPGAAANVVSGGTAWSNVNNALVDDAANSDVSIAVSATFSDYLALTQFGLSLPSGSTVVGVDLELTYEGTGNDADAATFGPYLTKNGTATAGAQKLLDTNPTGQVTSVVGGSSDLWGTTLTEAEVEATTFGVLLEGRSGDASAAQYIVDFARLRVYYTEPISNAPETLRIASSGARWT